MTQGTPPNAQPLLQGLLKCRDCGIHMITVADPDGRPTHYACPKMLNNETDNCSIPKLEIHELDKFILEKALEHLLSESISQDTVSKMQEAIAASVNDFDTAKYTNANPSSDITAARDTLHTVIWEIVVGPDTVEVKYVDQKPEGAS